jgi:hypothetical protein
MTSMVRALLTCSEDDCTEVFEAYGRLEDIEALACECGCGLAVVGWPDSVNELPSNGTVELVPLAA